MRNVVGLAVISILLGLIGIVGCNEQVDIGPPEGWVAEGNKWWKPGVDTSLAFRPLDTFEDMGVSAEKVVFDSSKPFSAQPEKMRRQLVVAVKYELFPVFRNHPEVVDSLFNALVVPKIMRATPPKTRAEFGQAVQRWKREAYRIIVRHFREPRPRLQLGKDVPVVYPDSLQERGIGGTVKMQIYLNESGEPVAVWVLKGVHPVLDQSAMRSATQMRWMPAYLDGKPVPSWVRFSITFSPPPSVTTNTSDPTISVDACLAVYQAE